ncbi:hypothetical protein D3C80_1526350 [compost metagenome]
MVIRIQFIDHPLNPRSVCSGLEGMAFEMLIVIDIIDGISVNLSLAAAVVIINGECGQGAGIKTAGQQGADRNVGDELALQRILQQFAYFGGCLIHIIGVVVALQFPICILADSIPVINHGMTRA